MKKKILLVAAALILFSFAPKASALTDQERSALIAQLTQQLALLQAQLVQLLANQQGSTGTTWCHTFNTNLVLGTTSDEVAALNTALTLQGYNTGSSNYFSIGTKSAVVAFQERYASEILYPIHLTYGTGNVGIATRAKLNQLYQCPPITILFPAGGETLQVGDTARITWKAPGLSLKDSVVLTVSMPQNPNVNVKKIATVLASTGYYDWKISATTLPSTSYPIVLSIKATSTLNKNIAVSSATFSVNSFDNSVSNISLIYPQGGQILYLGDTARVAWNSKGLSSTDKVNISIFSPANPYSNVKVIASSVLASQGYFDWKISSATLPSTSYPVALRARIDVVGKNISSSSTSDFTVNSSNQGLDTISIIYPSGGETFSYNPTKNTGDTPRITWSTTGFTTSDTLTITVHSVAEPYLNVKVITSNVLASQGYFDWHIGKSTLPDLNLPENLFLKIESTAKNVSAMSNAFTVSAP